MSMYDIRNSAESSDELDIYIYSDIDSCWWNPDAMSANKFRKELEKHKDAKQINLYINSMGGSVSEGVTIYNQIRRHSAKVTAYIDGFACSIASVIPMAADEVVMGENTMLMIHNPWTITWGNAKDLRKTAEDLDKVRDGCIIPAYKARCGDKLSDEKLIELLDNETFLTAAECLEYGLCDKILTITKDEKKTEAENMVKEAMDHAKEGFMSSFAERFGSMVAKAKSLEGMRNEEPENPAKAEKNDANAVKNAENAAEKQHTVTKHLYDALGNVVAECELPLGTPGKIALYADGEIIAEADEPDVTDTNDGDIKTESEPEKAESKPEPVEDKVKTNDYFMKLLKGEM